MQKVRVELGDRSYNVCIDEGSIGNIGSMLEKFEFSRSLGLVTNPTVRGLYGDEVALSLKNAGFTITEIVIPDGEEHKNLEWIEKIYDSLLTTRLDRRSALVALGGGVIGDIAGFAAATYMRGIDFIQVPTTLLAQVDSSVGGKTGVNHPLGKNMIGAFWQPRLVWVDIETLRTLPKSELLAGLAEVIKYGIIWDEELFSFLEENVRRVLDLDPVAIKHIIKRSCEIKAEVVSEDEREAGLRAILNYGHTVGHAIETLTKYTTFLHGEAVAIGMRIEAGLAEDLGLLTADRSVRIRDLISAYGLPVDLPTGLDVSPMMEAMQRDKKTERGRLRIVLPEKIGKVRIESGVSTETLQNVLRRKS